MCIFRHHPASLALRPPVACAPGVFLWDTILAKKSVNCYIDGFNLYHSIDDLGPKFNYLKWLDLVSLAGAFIKTSTEHLKSVYYFSALAYWLKEPRQRHEEFIKAVKHFGVTPIFFLDILRKSPVIVKTVVQKGQLMKRSKVT